MTQDANQYKGGKAVVQGVNCLTLGHPEAHRVYGEDGAAPSVCANEGGGDARTVFKPKAETLASVRRARHHRLRGVG